MSTYQRGKLIRFIPNLNDKAVAVFQYHDRWVRKPAIDVVYRFDLGITIEQAKEQAPQTIDDDD